VAKIGRIFYLTARVFDTTTTTTTTTTTSFNQTYKEKTQENESKTNRLAVVHLQDHHTTHNSSDNLLSTLSSLLIFQSVVTALI